MNDEIIWQIDMAPLANVRIGAVVCLDLCRGISLADGRVIVI